MKFSGVYAESSNVKIIPRYAGAKRCGSESDNGETTALVPTYAGVPTFDRLRVKRRTRQNTHVYPFLFVRLELDILQAQMKKRTCSDDPRRTALLGRKQRNVRCVDIVLCDSPYEGEFSLTTSHSRRP
jgi:hypothetical protein